MSAPTCTVLIIEDSPPDQELYRRCLLADSSCAYRFLEADTAELGLALCQTQVIDAILLDYSLPDANGLTFLEALQTRSSGHSPPVVMVSGEGDERVAVRAIKLGAEDYLVKRHLTPELLQLTLRSAIENAHLRLQLQQSEHRFRTSIENLLDCFGIYSAIRDASGQIIDFRVDYLNTAALESNQMTPADIGSGLCEHLPAHRESGLFEAYCRVVETGEPLVKENLLYSDAFGQQFLTRAYDLQASKLDDGFVASWRDVTARRQAELERLRIEDERQQQLERERILNQITQQIRRSLNPTEVLNTAVAEIRQFLRGDRAFIYRFNPDFSGVIVVESVATGWDSALAAAVEDTYFMSTFGEDYRQGRIQVVEDIYTAGLTDCHLAMLERFQIRANLVVPILQGENLWGLLVVNQCDRPRPWQSSQVELLKQIATQIGIAIQQAELYQQVEAHRERLELSLEGSQQGMWDANLVTGQSYWSPQCKRLFGLEPDHLPVSDDQFYQCVHPEDRERVVTVLQTLFQTHHDYDIEYRVVWADGTVRWLHSRGKVLRDGQGQPRQILGTVTDISDRRRLEEALWQNEERLRLAVQGAGMATWDMDLQTGRAVWSEGHFHLLGYKPHPAGEATQAMWHTCVHPDDLPQVMQAIEQARQNRSICTSEYRVIRADNGEVRWIQAFGQFLYDEIGEATRFLGIFFDATSFKRNEQRLQASEEQLKLGVQVSGVAIAHFDYATDSVLLSPEAARIYGFSAGQSTITRDQIHATFHPEEFDQLMVIIQQVLDPAGPGWFAREHRVVWPDGAVRWLNVRKQVFFDRSGPEPRPHSAILAAVDITDRKQAEAALRQSEERYRYLAGLIPQLVWIADSDGTMLDVNDRWSDYTGLTLEEAQRQGWAAIVHPDDVAVLGAAWSMAQQEGAYYQAEGRMRRADGVYRWHLHQAMPLKDGQDQLVKWFGTATDIHELKLIEADRARLLAESEAARAEAEAANRSKDEFVALVAHELRSPLNAVLGWVRLLQSSQLDADTTVRALDTITRNTYAQVQLVEDLLDVSRIVRGTLQLTLAPTNLSEVVAAAVETIRPTATAKRLRLDVQINDTATICGDFNRLQQVVLNLLTNATKFTAEGGHIQVTLDQQASQACLQIRDNGQGIRPEFLPLVFERFNQGQQSSTTKQGLGLGLAIVKYLVEQHGGTITVESPGEGQGATFTVTLPLQADEPRYPQDEVAPSSPLSSETHPLDGVRILLVDDEPDILELVAFILEDYGATVQTANSTAAALEVLTQFRPNILLSDIAMPNANGYALMQQVRMLDPEGQIPAIALTAYASETCYEESLRAGFQQHFTKPVEPEQLVAAILNLVQQIPKH